MGKQSVLHSSCVSPGVGSADMHGYSFCLLSMCILTKKKCYSNKSCLFFREMSLHTFQDLTLNCPSDLSPYHIINDLTRPYECLSVHTDCSI